MSASPPPRGGQRPTSRAYAFLRHPRQPALPAADVRTGLKRLQAMMTVMAAGAALAASAAAAEGAREYPFDWPRQPLHNALQQYSQLTGDSVLYDLSLIHI